MNTIKGEVDNEVLTNDLNRFYLSVERKKERKKERPITFKVEGHNLKNSIFKNKKLWKDKKRFHEKPHEIECSKTKQSVINL